MSVSLCAIIHFNYRIGPLDIKLDANNAIISHQW